MLMAKESDGSSSSRMHIYFDWNIAQCDMTQQSNKQTQFVIGLLDMSKFDIANWTITFYLQI